MVKRSNFFKRKGEGVSPFCSFIYFHEFTRFCRLMKVNKRLFLIGGMDNALSTIEEVWKEI